MPHIEATPFFAALPLIDRFTEGSSPITGSPSLGPASALAASSFLALAGGFLAADLGVFFIGATLTVCSGSWVSGVLLKAHKI